MSPLIFIYCRVLPGTGANSGPFAGSGSEETGAGRTPGERRVSDPETIGDVGTKPVNSGRFSPECLGEADTMVTPAFCGTRRMPKIGFRLGVTRTARFLAFPFCRAYIIYER